MSAERVLDGIQSRSLRVYGEGVADGMIIALELLLGDPSSGGAAYRGNLDPEVRSWAQLALGRARMERGNQGA